MTTGSRAEGTSLRMKKPGLRDPKLIIGVLLIIVSVLAVIGIVHATNRTQTYYAATRDLHVGDHISESDIKQVDVRLGGAEELYLDSPVGESVYAIDNIQAGEIVSKQDLAENDSQGRRVASIILDTAIAQSFANGEIVDVWVSAKSSSGSGFEDPQVIAQNAEISHVTAEESMIGGTGKSAVHLLVEDSSLPDVLAAVNNEDKINLIPSNFAGASS